MTMSRSARVKRGFNRLAVLGSGGMLAISAFLIATLAVSWNQPLTVQINQNFRTVDYLESPQAISRKLVEQHGPPSMAKFQVTAPNGHGYEVISPPGTSRDDIVKAARRDAGLPEDTPLERFKAKYPEYKDMSDADLANALYAKFYSDMPRATFDAKIGLKSSGADNTRPVPPDGFKVIESGETKWWDADPVVTPKFPYEDEITVALEHRQAGNKETREMAFYFAIAALAWFACVQVTSWLIRGFMAD